MENQAGGPPRVLTHAKSLAKETYRFTTRHGVNSDGSLKDQMRRAAISVASNIAEGEWRWQTKDGNRFFLIAKGSAAELKIQAELCGEIGLAPDNEAQRLADQCDHVAAMLHKLIAARERRLEEKGEGPIRARRTT